MSRSFLLSALSLAAAATLALSAAGAQTLKQTPGSRISVTQCNPHRHSTGTLAHPWIDPYGVYHNDARFPYEVGFLGITYANNAHSPVKEVDFGLVARSSLIAIVKDVGTFSPGAKIDHEFSVDPEIFPIGTAFPQCAVLRVKYADGREWRNPDPPSP